MEACSSISVRPPSAPSRLATGPNLPRSITTPSRGLPALRRAHLVNAATVEKTETDLTAELRDVLSRVKPKVHSGSRMRDITTLWGRQQDVDLLCIKHVYNLKGWVKGENENGICGQKRHTNATLQGSILTLLSPDIYRDKSPRDSGMSAADAGFQSCSCSVSLRMAFLGKACRRPLKPQDCILRDSTSAGVVMQLDQVHHCLLTQLGLRSY